MSEAPNPCLIGSAPLFLVADVVRAAAYYRDVLGFSYERLWGEPPCFCMPKRDGFIVMLQQVEAGGQVRTNAQLAGNGDQWDAYFWITDADALFAEFKARGAIIEYEPCIREYYDMKEFAVRDADGYILAFGQDWSAT